MLEYRVWQHGVVWHWQVTGDHQVVLASGIAESSLALRPPPFPLTTKATRRSLKSVGPPTMPRYFFHLHGSDAHDADGQEFPDDEAAREEAIAVALDLARNRNVATGERIIVTDASGTVVHDEPLARR
jgi:hypothetical protein